VGGSSQRQSCEVVVDGDLGGLVDKIIVDGFGHLLAIEVIQELVAVVWVEGVELQLHWETTTLSSIHFYRGRLRDEQRLSNWSSSEAERVSCAPASSRSNF
jgi:hypothetical protein